MKALREHQPSLRPNLSNSAYPCITFNLGPQTVCNAHNDSTNYPGVPCAITPLGTFDPDEGGELVFYDYKLIVRFPPASTALLSSAGVRHGNKPIRKGEKRYSVTQFCVGGLKRWVRHGFRPASHLSDEERARLDGNQ